MAKKKVPDKPTPASRQKKLMRWSMDTMTVHELQCFVCGSKEDTDVESEVEFARSLYADGWRWMTSKKLNTAGAMCPQCVALPDKQRGE